MKKKLIVGIVLMLVTAMIPLVPNTTMAHTVDDPLEVDLIAGGGHGQENGDGYDGIDAGDVLVWNDEDTLYIKYVAADPWVITETHLHVALSMGAIPQKEGNPIPGHFEYKDEWDPPITEHTYEYDLADWGWTPGTVVYIAAHAVVLNQYYEPVWQIGDVETGQMDNPCDGIFWDPFPASYYPPFPEIDNPFVIGTSDNDDFPWITHPPTASQPFAYDYDIGWSGALPFGGRVVLSWSPGKSSTDIVDIYLDEGATPILTLNKVGINYPDWFHGWKRYEYTIGLDPLFEGDHALNLDHTAGDGAVWDWIRLEKSCEQRETAWAHGFDFSGANWATYVEYTIQGWQFYDSFSVPATTATPTVSSEILESGVTYKIVASGTYFFRNEGNLDGYLADAEWALRDDAYGTGWVIGDSAPYSFPYNGLDLCFDTDTNTNWGALDEATHTYTIYYTGTGTQLSLFIKDNVYTDNSGGLTVQIYEWA